MENRDNILLQCINVMHDSFVTICRVRDREAETFYNAYYRAYQELLPKREGNGKTPMSTGKLGDYHYKVKGGEEMKDGLRLVQLGENGEHFAWRGGPFESQHFSCQEYAISAYDHQLLWVDTRTEKHVCSVCGDKLFATITRLR